MFFKQWVCLVHGTLLKNCSAWQIGGECFVNNYSVSFGHCLLCAYLSDLQDLWPGSFRYSTCGGICNLPIQRQLTFHAISDLAGQYKQYSITQFKCKLHLAKYSNIYIQSSHESVILSPSPCWASPLVRKAYVLVEAGSSLLTSSKLFCYFLGFYTLCWAKPQLLFFRYSILPVLIWPTQGDIPTLLINSGRNIYNACWPTQLLIAVYLKQRPPSGPLGAKSASIKQLWSAKPCIIPWASWNFSLPILSVPLSIAGVFWSVIMLLEKGRGYEDDKEVT